VKERPILFSGPMVRAILEGRKTQTRRVYKPAKGFPRQDGEITPIASEGSQWTDYGPCPYGVPGDRLWVREQFSFGKGWDSVPAGKVTKGEQVWYHADGSTVGGSQLPTSFGRGRPSIHMPRWACRLVLEVVSLRVERVQEIGGNNALAEGFDAATCEAFLSVAAGKQRSPEYPCYVRFDDGSESDGWHCYACARRELGAKAGHVVEDRCTPETDGPAYCDECHTPLLVSLTAYGIDRELLMECDDGENVSNFSATGMDAAIAAMFAGGIGDLQDAHRPRLAQIGFATAWDSINGKGSWALNPWVWVIEFKKVS